MPEHCHHAWRATLATSALVIAIVATSAGAQARTAVRVASDTAVATLSAQRRSGSIAIDGRLDDEAWRGVVPSRHFTQSYPNPGKPPVDSMEVRILYDDQALYVGLRMFDAHPDSIAAPLARRDATGIYSDWVHVIIDSYHDRRTAFRFSLNPAGVQKDVYTSDDGNEDLNWDAVWESATRVDSLGWVAELRIPLSQLRYGGADSGATRTWGIQIMRDVARRNERDAFSPWTPESPGFVSRFGDLVGLVDVQTPHRLELLPYVSSRATSAPGSASNPFYSRLAMKQSAGADLRAGLPGGLTLSATANPDFGQVEVDPAVVNLTAFETFFPEKRPFFLEGSDVFSFGQVRRYNDYSGQYFLYSRRIGRPPQRSPYGGNVAFADAPDQTTILGAAKVTGKHGPWTIGVQNAVTAREVARVQLADGTERTTPVEPLTDYFATRLRHDFRDGQTVIGALAAGETRDMSDHVFDPMLSRSADLGGVDFEHAFHHHAWYLSGFAAGTQVSGTPSLITRLERAPQRYYQRPDAGYVSLDTSARSLGGYAAELALESTGDWITSVALKTVSPGFENNDIGFLNRADYRSASYLVGYQNSQVNRWSRQRSGYLYVTQAWNYGGSMIFNQAGANALAVFPDFWSLGVSATGAARYFDDRLTRGGPLAATPAGASLGVTLESDSRRPIVVTANVFGQRDEFGGHSGSAGILADSRPATNVHVTFGPTLSWLHGTTQYVTAVRDANATSTYGTRYVFSDIDQSTLSLDTRIDWTFTPRLSLQTYIQPFVAAAHYVHFKEFTTPHASVYSIYGVDRGSITRNDTTGVLTVDPDAAGPSPAFSFHDPTFNFRSLRGNAVLRYEYRPGSAIYLVWQQLRAGATAIGDFDAQRDVGAIFVERPTNVFLVKASYWLSR